MERARRFNVWMGDTIRPFVGDRVLEVGAGIGTLTSQFVPRDEYVVSDVNPHYLDYLRSYGWGKPYLRVMRLDARSPEDFAGLEERFDTALMINVLEHLDERRAVLGNLHRVLEPDGRAIILVPQHPRLYGSLDEALDHKLRYTPVDLREDLESAGFEVEKLFDFNRFSVPGWWLNARVLRRRTFSRVQLKLLDTMIPIIKRVDRLLPWQGLSVIAVGRKRS
jgi:SAM-dependent methyltransferase